MEENMAGQTQNWLRTEDMNFDSENLPYLQNSNSFLLFIEFPKFSESFDYKMLTSENNSCHLEE